MPIRQITIIGTGLIGGSLGLALKKRKFAGRIIGCDREATIEKARMCGAIDAGTPNPGDSIHGSQVVVLATPVLAIVDLIERIGPALPAKTLLTDVGSTKSAIVGQATKVFGKNVGKRFLAGHPMAGRELSGIAHADPDLFRNTTYALIGEPPAKLGNAPRDPRETAFTKILEKIGARPVWLGAQQHDYAVGLASHLPQLAAVALASFLYDRLDENGLPITLAGPGLRDSLRLAGSPYHTWRDIVLTNREVLSAALDLFARRLDDLRERLGSRELEADFDAANELYKLLRSL